MVLWELALEAASPKLPRMRDGIDLDLSGPERGEVERRDLHDECREGDEESYEVSDHLSLTLARPPPPPLAAASRNRCVAYTS